MKFSDALVAARHHIVFLIGLCAAFGLVIFLESLDRPPVDLRIVELEETSDITLSEPRPLTAQEQQWARIAWRYFEVNYHADTGLVNSVDKYPAATLWDTASYLMGLISAYRLGIVPQEEFDSRMGKALKTLASLELFDDQLPNKSYNSMTTAMVDYQNNVTERGIGWSAIDIGRIMVPLNILIWNYPQHTDAVQTILDKWDMDAMLVDGVMMGATIDNEGNTKYVQEGRIGYEEYAAKSLSLMGYDVSKALMYVDFLAYESIYGIDIPTDLRDPEIYAAHNYVVSESYILDGLEFGWDFRSKEFAFRVYAAQQKRYENEGVLTAVSEDNIDEAPYFVYNTVFSSGEIWKAITEDGHDAAEHKTISTKAVFGWHALYATPYTELLVDKVDELYDPERGWYSGWYEKKEKPNTAITANTNGIVLESLAYRALGVLLHDRTAITNPDVIVAEQQAALGE